jgi:hypothetical protein
MFTKDKYVEDGMKTTNLMKKLVVYPGLWLLQVTPLWAAEAAGREDNSDLFVWIFLGFCALIIVAQLIPALLVLFGFAKGVKREKAATVAPVPDAVDTLITQEGGRD